MQDYCRFRQLAYPDPLKDTMFPNALPAHTTVLDEQGVIVDVNDAWKEFGAENGLLLPDSGVGMNYLDLCHATLGPAHRLCFDLGALLQGRAALITWVYACHAPTKRRWFNLIGTRLPDGRGGALLSHIDITDLVGQQALEEGPMVETSRPALIPVSILPQRIEGDGSDSAGEEVISGLSTRQREVLTFLQQGRTIKEIAAALGISPATAKTHVAAVMRRLRKASDPEPQEDSLIRAQRSARLLRLKPLSFRPR